MSCFLLYKNNTLYKTFNSLDTLYFYINGIYELLTFEDIETKYKCFEFCNDNIYLINIKNLIVNDRYNFRKYPLIDTLNILELKPNKLSEEEILLSEIERKIKEEELYISRIKKAEEENIKNEIEKNKKYIKEYTEFYTIDKQMFYRIKNSKLDVPELFEKKYNILLKINTIENTINDTEIKEFLTEYYKIVNFGEQKELEKYLKALNIIL